MVISTPYPIPSNPGSTTVSGAALTAIPGSATSPSIPGICSSKPPVQQERSVMIWVAIVCDPGVGRCLFLVAQFHASGTADSYADVPRHPFQAGINDKRVALSFSNEEGASAKPTPTLRSPTHRTTAILVEGKSCTDAIKQYVDRSTTEPKSMTCIGLRLSKWRHEFRCFGLRI